MKYILIALLLTGCSTTVPVTVNFPQSPVELKQRCVDLKIIKQDAKLSDVTKTVVENYTTYHECSLKVDAWIEWYDKQKKIFEETK